MLSTTERILMWYSHSVSYISGTHQCIKCALLETCYVHCTSWTANSGKEWHCMYAWTVRQHMYNDIQHYIPCKIVHTFLILLHWCNWNWRHLLLINCCHPVRRTDLKHCILWQAQRKHFKGGHAGQVRILLPRWPLAQARKNLSYRKAWADLKIWSGQGLGSLGGSAGHV